MKDVHPLVIDIKNPPGRAGLLLIGIVSLIPVMVRKFSKAGQ